MVWTTKEQLQDARLSQPLFAVDSLFDKACKAQIPIDTSIPEKHPDQLLTNTQLLTRLVETGQIRPEEATRLQATVTAGSKLDDNLDKHQAFWSDIQMAVLFSSLPETYAHSEIAARLAASGQLMNRDTAGKRLAGTDEMITAIVAGLADGSGTGLHRAFLLGARHQRLSQASGNRLINQVTLAFTLLTFSFTPFEAMARGGASVPEPDRRQAWLAMWNVVGSLKGIGLDGLPDTLEEAAALAKLIRSSDEYRRTPEGEQLITALVEHTGSVTTPFFELGGEDLMNLLGVQRPPQ